MSHCLPGGLAVEPLQQTLQQNRALHRSTTHAVRHAADVELYSSTALQSALHLYSSTALYTLHPLHPPSGLVIIRWQPSASPATRTNGCALVAPCLPRGTAAIGCHRITTSHGSGGWLQSLCPSHSRWLKWLSPSHLSQDGCNVARSAKRAHLEAGGVAAVVRLQPCLLRMAAVCVLQPSG